MKKKYWIIGTVAVILIVAAAAGGYLFGRHSGLSGGSETPITALKSQITTLEYSLNTLKSDVSQINPVLQSHVNAIVDVVNILQPAILRITVDGDSVLVSGSGFIIRSDGYAITNHHVIETPGAISVTVMSGDKYAATVVGSDSVRDLALLKLDSTRTDFPVAVLALAPQVVVGEDVVACGFPLGFDLPGPASFTKGIISAIRTLNDLSFVQTDCEIDPGSSGGCLVNSACEVVGVTTDAVLPPNSQLEAIALAIPVTDVQSFIQIYLK